MFALGTGIDLRTLFRARGRPALLGAAATLLAAGVAYIGLRLSSH
jgi:hypothetical protein